MSFFDTDNNCKRLLSSDKLSSWRENTMNRWYDNAVIYQIYPKSFKDSNQDGIGDLNGIKSKIPYLKSLGINAVWLNPIFVSPQVDNGYDVSNYFAIDPKMGTMTDMEKLITAFHQAGIRIILDFVLNHTSDQHPWFQDAIKNPHSLYRNYYIFAGKDNVRPNNWGSFFGGSVWEKDPSGSGQFYFHLFDKRMPDLNWENPQVRKEMLQIAEFWLAKGIDGLRLDAFIHIAKAKLNQDYPGKDPVVAEPFFANLPAVTKWLRPFCKQIKQDYPDCFLLGEAASANVNQVALYTAKEQELLDSAITFRCFTEDTSNIDTNLPASFQEKPLDFNQFKEVQLVWQQILAQTSKPVLYWSNHDMARLRTRVANNDCLAKSLAMLQYLQNGIPIIYYGEELGLENLRFDNIQDFCDQTVNDFSRKAEKLGYSQEKILDMVSKTHKLPARGVMPWDKSEFFGFSSNKPWINGQKLDDKYVTSEEKDPDSFLNFYKQLIKLKKTPLFEDGDFQLEMTDANSYIYERSLGQEAGVVAVNLSNQEINLKLKSNYQKILLANGEVNLNDYELTLSPYAGVVIRRE